MFLEKVQKIPFIREGKLFKDFIEAEQNETAEPQALFGLSRANARAVQNAYPSTTKQASVSPYGAGMPPLAGGASASAQK
jgi:carboxylesterase type B|tara:strand:- start:71 stop:310 length:240 start_codon:yes stop_codon:yes gene_type:complete